MTIKQQLLNSINGIQNKTHSWSPFLAYFWENQTEEVLNKGQLAFMEEIGAQPLLRGFKRVANVEMHNCNISEVTTGNKRTKCYETDLGTISEEYTYTSDTWFLTKHAIVSKDDLSIFKDICKNIKIESKVNELNTEIKQIGDRGLLLPLIGLFGKSSFQSLLEHWIGTENLVYALMDYPEEIHECLSIMQSKSNEVAELAASCNAKVFISWEDSSTTNISPAYYQKYILPEINNWCDILHSKNKKYIQHACGHLKHLLPIIAESNIDGIDSLSPPPTGDIDVIDAINILPEHMVIIGGLEPVFLINASDEELKDRIYSLLDCMKNRRFILANSDSCPPEVTIERLYYINDILKDYRD